MGSYSSYISTVERQIADMIAHYVINGKGKNEFFSDIRKFKQKKISLNELKQRNPVFKTKNSVNSAKAMIRRIYNTGLKEKTKFKKDFYKKMRSSYIKKYRIKNLLNKLFWNYARQDNIIDFLFDSRKAFEKWLPTQPWKDTTIGTFKRFILDLKFKFEKKVKKRVVVGTMTKKTSINTQPTDLKGLVDLYEEKLDALVIKAQQYNMLIIEGIKIDATLWEIKP